MGPVVSGPCPAVSSAAADFPFEGVSDERVLARRVSGGDHPVPARWLARPGLDPARCGGADPRRCARPDHAGHGRRELFAGSAGEAPDPRSHQGSGGTQSAGALRRRGIHYRAGRRFRSRLREDRYRWTHGAAGHGLPGGRARGARAFAAASGLPMMIYNNPPAYNVDVTPEGFKELASERRVVAIKESSEDTRRLVDIVNLTGDRYTLFCGVDDLLLESMLLGAVGWVSGLVNVFPKESVRLWELASKGEWERAKAIYRWFMPTLHLDTSPKLVQMIKLGQKNVGNGSAVTRAPRLPLEGEELKRVTRLYEEAIANRPTL